MLAYMVQELKMLMKINIERTASYQLASFGMMVFEGNSEGGIFRFMVK